MKRFLLVLIVAMVCLCGCSKDKSSDNSQNAAEFAYEIDGVKIVPGDSFEKALGGLGETVSYSEAASCYFDGMDKIFAYDGYEIRTYPAKDGKDYIQDISISSDKYSTDKGITVGSTLSDVEAAYGKDYVISGKMYKYYYAKTKYSYFFIMDDAVKYFGYAIEASN